MPCQESSWDGIEMITRSVAHTVFISNDDVVERLIDPYLNPAEYDPTTRLPFLTLFFDGRVSSGAPE